MNTMVLASAVAEAEKREQAKKLQEIQLAAVVFREEQFRQLSQLSERVSFAVEVGTELQRIPGITPLVATATETLVRAYAWRVLQVGDLSDKLLVWCLMIIEKNDEIDARKHERDEKFHVQQYRSRSNVSHRKVRGDK